MKSLKLKILEVYDSQINFAKALGCSDSVISRVLTGYRSLSNEEIQLWASLLNIKPSDVTAMLK